MQVRYKVNLANQWLFSVQIILASFPFTFLTTVALATFLTQILFMRFLNLSGSLVQPSINSCLLPCLTSLYKLQTILFNIFRCRSSCRQDVQITILSQVITQGVNGIRLFSPIYLQVLMDYLFEFEIFAAHLKDYLCCSCLPSPIKPEQ